MRRKTEAATGLPQGEEKILEFQKKALDLSIWRTGFGRGYGHPVRQTGE
jgi:hypothetical protein